MSFWKTLGKIGALAAPIVAAPFTGGASLALIGAGAGAAGSALNGAGLKGTLLGAGIGGATAGIGGGGGSAAKGASHMAGSGGFTNILKTVGKQVLKHPDAIASLGSVASGAAKGSADQRMAQGNQALGYGSQALNAANDKATQDRANAQGAFDAAMKTAEFTRTAQDRVRANALRAQVLGNIQDVNISGVNPKIKIPTISGGLRPSVLTTNNGALMAELHKPELDAPTYAAPSPYVSPTLPTMPTQGMGEKILGGIGLGTSLLGTIGQMTMKQPQMQMLSPNNPNQPTLSPQDLAYLRTQNPNLLEGAA